MKGNHTVAVTKLDTALLVILLTVHKHQLILSGNYMDRHFELHIHRVWKNGTAL